MRRTLSWTLPMAAAIVAGCGGGSSDGLPHQSISGNVTLDGQPLAAGIIVFVPQGFEGVPVGAEIKDGAYSAMGEEGPVPGPHSVSISAKKPTGKSFSDADNPSVMIEETFETVPPRYNTRTELKAEVTDDGENKFDFALEGEIKTPPPPSRRKS